MMCKEDAEAAKAATASVNNPCGGNANLFEDEEAKLRREDFQSWSPSEPRSPAGGRPQMVPAPFEDISLDDGEAEDDEAVLDKDWVSFPTLTNASVAVLTRGSRMPSAHNGTGHRGAPELEFDDEGMVEVESDVEDDLSDGARIQATPGPEEHRPADGRPRQPPIPSQPSVSSQIFPTRARIVALQAASEEVTREVVRSVRCLAVRSVKTFKTAAETARVLSGRTTRGVAELLKEGWGSVPPERLLDSRRWR